MHDQAESARRYQDLFERLRTLEMNIFLLKQDKLAARMQELNQTCEALRDALLQHEAHLHQNSMERTELDDAIAALDDALNQARAESRLRSEELHQIESARDRMEQHRDTLLAESARLDEDAASRRERLAELDRTAARGEDEDETARNALAAAKQSLDAAEKEADKAASQADQIELELDKHKADILTAVNRLSDARNARTQKETMCAQMENYLVQLRESEAELVTAEETLKTQHNDALALQAQAQQELDVARTEAQNLEAKVRALSAENDEQERHAQELALGMQSARSRLKVLTEMARDMEGYANAVRRALQFGHDDPRVCGVVAQLMQAPQELEAALDAVMGGSLQNIVTEDDETAKRLIEYLKTAEAGRATFLPINTVRSYSLTAEERRVLSMPGCLGVASELVTYDSKYRPVMENLLGRTVVARDLDAALPIMRAGRYAFRLVTLDGQVMHSGGSMTGGSMRGKTTNFLSREREIKELNARLKADEQSLQKMHVESEQLQKRRQEARRLRDEGIEAMHQQEIAVAREQEHVFNAASELEAHQQRLDKTRAAILQLTESIEELQKDLQSLDQGTQDAAIDREAMDRRTEELQAALRTARKEADLQRDRVTQEKLHYAELEHALEILRRDKARWAEEKESLTGSLQRLEQKAAEQREQAQQAEAQWHVLQDNVTEQQQAVQQAEQETEQLEQQRQERLARQRALAQENDDLHERHSQDSEQLHRTELLYARAENEQNALTEHMWNTYEATRATAEEYRLPEGQFFLTSGERDANQLRREIRDLGPINAHAVEEYAQVKERFDDLSRQRDDMIKAESDLRSLIKRLLSQMEKQFVAEFDKLNASFQNTFVRLFGGGQAELRLTDPNEPLSCGIEVIAQPPGKKLQLLSLLSGGERALTAMAILFAMLTVKPTPFCILDEIEAALDEANIGYFADYLAEFAKTTQFVVITHRKGTMERCDALYGVAMEEKGVSSMVSVNLENYA